MYRIDTACNGITVITKQMPGVHSASLGIWVDAGSRYEEERTAGISHFTEHMLFKGTTSRSMKEISMGIEGIGGSLNAFTAEEFTCYTAKMRGEKFETGMEILSDMICSPLFDTGHIEQERQVILEEIKMYLDTPAQHVQELINTILWPQHPLGRPVIGYKETVSNIQKSDFMEFIKKGYVRQNMVVCACGNVSHDKVIKTVERYLNPGQGSRNSMDSQTEGDGQRSIIFTKDTEQIHLCMGVRGYSRNHPKRFALKLLSIVLGENMSSYLFQEVRERLGLAYDIHSYLTFYRDSGSLVITAGVEKKNAPKLVEKVSQIAAQAASGNLITEQDLSRAKEYYLGQFSISMEKTMSTMLWAGESYLCTGKILSYEDISGIVENTTIEDVLTAAKEIFGREAFRLAVVGNVKENAMAARQMISAI